MTLQELEDYKLFYSRFGTLPSAVVEELFKVAEKQFESGADDGEPVKAEAPKAKRSKSKEV